MAIFYKKHTNISPAWAGEYFQVWGVLPSRDSLVYNIITQPLKEAEAANYTIVNKFISSQDYELVAAKLMDQGPVLVISFVTEQIVYVEDARGNLVEGNKDTLMRVDNVWAFCRDMQELNPEAAWRILDMSSTSSEQWI